MRRANYFRGVLLPIQASSASKRTRPRAQSRCYEVTELRWLNVVWYYVHGSCSCSTELCAAQNYVFERALCRLSTHSHPWLCRLEWLYGLDERFWLYTVLSGQYMAIYSSFGLIVASDSHRVGIATVEKCFLVGKVPTEL